MSPVGILIDMAGRIVFVNPSFLRLVGAETPEQVYRRSVPDFIHPDGRRIMEEMIKKVEDDFGEYVPLVELKLVRLDGTPIVAEVTGFAITLTGSRGFMAVMEDVTERKKAQAALKEREKELEQESANLREANAALRVLLRQREEDRTTLETTILQNIKELVLPNLRKLRHAGLDRSTLTNLEIAETRLMHVTSSFVQKMKVIHLQLTAKEIQVADLIKNGQSSKEIAMLFNVSCGTVDTYRNSIRQKLGLRNKKVNLRTYLLSI